ncbi:MAG: hypothetical protein Q9209_005547 [Squamulea sp. 1 TL-2023]
MLKRSHKKVVIRLRAGRLATTAQLINSTKAMRPKGPEFEDASEASDFDNTILQELGQDSTYLAVKLNGRIGRYYRDQHEASPPNR